MSISIAPTRAVGRPNRKRQARQEPREVSDVGPLIRRQRGDVAILDAADPSAPNRTIRRAKVVCHYDALFRNGSLSSEQREAADCYSMLVALSQGVRQGNGGVGRTPPWMQGHPAVMTLRAVREVASADAALGPSAKAIVWALAVENIPVINLATTMGVNPQVARGLVVAALNRLAEHMENRSSQRLVDRR